MVNKYNQDVTLNERLSAYMLTEFWIESILYSTIIIAVFKYKIKIALNVEIALPFLTLR